MMIWIFSCLKIIKVTETLSGGRQQRTGVCRSMMTSGVEMPSIVFIILRHISSKQLHRGLYCAKSRFILPKTMSLQPKTMSQLSPKSQSMCIYYQMKQIQAHHHYIMMVTILMKIQHLLLQLHAFQQQKTVIFHTINDNTFLFGRGWSPSEIYASFSTRVLQINTAKMERQSYLCPPTKPTNHPNNNKKPQLSIY